MLQQDLHFVFTLPRPAGGVQAIDEPVAESRAPVGRAHAIELVDLSKARIGQDLAVQAEDQPVQLIGVHHPKPEQHLMEPAGPVPERQVVADGELQAQRLALGPACGAGASRVPREGTGSCPRSG